ncbi:drug resistance MFS transporter, drug:H+ antiporter-2 family protein [Yersinia pseudotuberculosis IP 32953]|uniref:Putative multidrug resistance protein MdtD n=1 Tax=Yersinia pseudotuberculosis serotype I (strain IP32953) TaxID=273123 RepID=MDTD_YERPS|nr:MFS transporter [Yersinia pseudotuberculosis]Q668C4.1 RecName: Full=Putative multidrug resistance protein MdtD [Yersinia pseudotuberculosis IP 32953]AJJ54936.1 drug resistance MFS transporter, drug:H+ antiporter-2 family protein [Yersinia pseudotuberculosis IP 32953]PSH46165.1 multidrug transporter subunit MdtD [Yersinia pseudotuberculosis]PSH49250.1 multidrug transporter subunit MdtD [Yersinia pseudotuberculosis]CAH22054.1 MFS superfamily drug efflux pump [Yersinia pseudotuberculosis IP 32
MVTQATSVRWQLWIVAFGFFMQTLDTTIVNTALPSIAASLGENPLRMQSVIVSYVLTVAVMLPASGWLADRIGVKWVFFSAIILFTFGSLMCAQSATLNELILSRVLQGVGDAMMVPVGRLTVMKIVPREQYMAAMAFVTLPGQIGPLVGPALGGFLVEFASWHWIFLINLPVGVIGALATLLLMPNHKMSTRRFDISGFIMLAIGMATLTLALDGHTGLGLSPLAIAGLILCGVIALGSYWWHALGNRFALFSLHLFKNKIYTLGLVGSMSARIGSGMLPFMTPIFLQIGLGFSPFHAGLMMIPMIIGSMGMKRIIVQVVNRFGYRRVLVNATLLLAVVSLSLPLVAIMGWTLLMPVVLFFQGMLNALRFSTMNTLTLKTLPDRLASSGNSLLSMAMQLSMSIGVSTAGILLGTFAHHQVATNTPATHSAFLYSYLCMAIIIALPALIFNRVPPDTGANRHLAR